MTRRRHYHQRISCTGIHHHGARFSPSLILLLLSVATSTLQWNKNLFSTVLIPRDVSYDNAARKALLKIRRLDENTAAAAAKEELLTSGNFHQVTLTMMGFKGGRLQDQVNQDRAFVCTPTGRNEKNTSLPVLLLLLLGVFDGHGFKGELVAQYALEQLPIRLSQKLYHIIFSNITSQQQESIIDNLIKQALTETYLEIDESIPEDAGGQQGGCTASIVLQLDHKLYIANAGDSTSFVALYNNSTNTTKIVHVTRDDKPHLPDEYERITKMGGVVNIPDDDYDDSSRVMYTDPASGYQVGLAMSRSIGDKDIVGVIAEPLVDVVDLREVIANELKDNNESTNDNDETCTFGNENVYIFAVSATDGMMDFLTPQEIATAFARAFYIDDSPHPLTVAEDLILRAAKGWNIEMNGEYRDDIAIAASKVAMPGHYSDQGDDYSESSSS